MNHITPTLPNATTQASHLSDQAKTRQYKVPIALSAALAFGAIAFWSIRREFGQTSTVEVFDSLRALSSGALGLAVMAMVVSYFCVAIYDSLAFRYTAKSIPLRKTVLGSFSAYAVSNTLGMPILTGNAIRARLYTKWGLTASEIAIVAIVSAVTLHACAVLLASLGLVLESRTFEQFFSLTPSLSIAFGAFGILFVATLSVIILNGPNERIVKAIIVKRPKPKWVAAQLTTGLLDYCAMAFCLFVLLPSGLELSFLAFLPVFVFAALIAGLSGLPGGIGVFEAIILLVMPRGSEAGVAASLIAFRAIYYLLPLLIAAILFSGHEIFTGRDKVQRHMERAEDFWQLLAPPLYTVLIFVMGVITLASAATPSVMPRLESLSRLVPFEVIEISHFFASLVGVLLLITALGLRRRLQNAWWLACALLASGFVLSVLKGGSLFETGLQFVLLVMLFLAKDAFYRRSLLRNLRLTVSRLAALAAGLSLFIWIGFLTYRGVDYSNALWWDFALNADASRFLRALAGVAVVSLVFCLWRALQPAPKALDAQSSAADMAKARKIIESAEGVRAEANLALLGDKQFLFSDSGQSFIMYGVRGNNWVAMGEPVGLRSERRDLIWKFRDLADIWNASPSFYAVSENSLTEFVNLGFVVQKIGEAAIIPLEGFTLDGPSKAKLRQARNKGIRNELVFEIVEKDKISDVIERLKIISDDWLKKHEGKEKGFSLGRFDERFIAEGPIAVVRQGSEILAFANIWTTHDKNELSIDLMRYHSDSPNGVMDFLFAELMLYSAGKGYKIFNLGMAPLSGLDDHRLAPLMSRLGSFVYKHGDAFYDFEGLRSFKEKFNPAWTPSYIAVMNARAIPMALGNLALLSGGGVLGLLVKN